MKPITLLSVGFAALWTCFASAKEIIEFKTEPDQGLILTDTAQEIAIKIDLTAHEFRPARRLPLNLAVVLDRSGSMTGAKIEQAKQAAIGLVDQISKGDIFSLVAYDMEVQVLVPAQPVEDKEQLKARIARIQPGGGTALYAGVEEGADQLQEYLSTKKINRVILLSDGLANVGPSSNEEIGRLGRRIAREGIAVSTIGVGDDYNEDLMVALAEASDANYYYVRDVETLPDIFAKELGELLAIVVRNIHLEIILPEEVEPIDFIGRPETFKNQRAELNLSHLASGQNRYLFLRCRVPEGKDGQTLNIAKIKATFRDETSDGKEQTLQKDVQIQFTKDRTEALASVNKAVATERDLMWNVVARDEAIRQADVNNYKEAAEALNVQADKLARSYAGAPPSMKPRLKEEETALRNQAKDMESGSMSRSERKVIQAESYKQKNAKQ